MGFPLLVQHQRVDKPRYLDLGDSAWGWHTVEAASFYEQVKQQYRPSPTAAYARYVGMYVLGAFRTYGYACSYVHGEVAYVASALVKDSIDSHRAFFHSRISLATESDGTSIFWLLCNSIGGRCGHRRYFTYFAVWLPLPTFSVNCDPDGNCVGIRIDCRFYSRDGQCRRAV